MCNPSCHSLRHLGPIKAATPTGGWRPHDQVLKDLVSWENRVFDAFKSLVAGNPHVYGMDDEQIAAYFKGAPGKMFNVRSVGVFGVHRICAAFLCGIYDWVCGVFLLPYFHAIYYSRYVP